MEGEGRKNYQWSTGQSKIVMTGVENGLSPTIIMRNLQTSGLPMRGLTKQQLYYKVNLQQVVNCDTEHPGHWFSQGGNWKDG